MPANDKPEGILSVSTEKRVFKPAKTFSARARVRSLAEYKKLYNESIRSPEKFWDKQAKNELVWFKPWQKSAGLESAVREMVRRRPTQCQPQLPR